MGDMKRAIAYEQRESQKMYRFASTLVIAASIIAAVRLARDDISKASPRLTTVVLECIGLARMIFEPDCEVNMPYKLVAAPHLLPAGDFKGHLETVTFVAASDTDPQTHKWWAVDVGTFEKDFTRIVSPELAQNIVYRLRQGEIVEFPNRYELEEVKGKFGGCWSD